MTTPTPAQPPVPAKEEPVLTAPENETALANLAMPLGEAVLKLQGEHDALLYGIMLRNRAVTSQSDFFRVQFRGFAMNANHTWTQINDEDSQYQNGRNCAWARVDHPSRSITFGPKAGVNIGERLQGTGLDDFLFAAVVSWCKHIYPDYKASPGMLMIQGGTSEEEKLHKQAFYAKQGFDFEWSADQRSGMYFKERVGRLIGVCESSRIVEFSGEDMLLSLIRQDEERKTLETRMGKIESMNNVVHQALDKEKHTTQVLTVIVVLMLVLVLWAII
jgi:hypothetical protein